MTDGNGWNKHELLVLETLNDHTERLERVEESVGRIRESLGETRGKQIVWAAIASIVIAAGATATMAMLYRQAPAQDARDLNRAVEELIQELRAKQNTPTFVGDKQ